MESDLPPSVNPEDVEYLMQFAEADPYVLGVLAEIDSYGGSGAGAELIANRLKSSSLPVAASVRESAISAGYLIATGADTIFASPFSDVGSIGITMSYLDNSLQNEDQGLEFISLASGKYKDAGTPDKPLTAEERALFERDLRIWHDVFVQAVAENRNLRLADVQALADGSSMAASLALQHGLIDAIGTREDARAWFAEKLEIPVEEVVFCE
jgi:protease-4